MDLEEVVLDYHLVVHGSLEDILRVPGTQSFANQQSILHQVKDHMEDMHYSLK